MMATTSANSLIAYYQSLLILQFLNLPKASGTVGALAQAGMIAQTDTTQPTLPLLLAQAFNISTIYGSTLAVGVQLDILAKYVGVSRNSTSFAGGAITLSDADLITLIQFGIINNANGSSLSQIQALIHQFFSGEVQVFDYANMYMSYLINSSLGSQNLIQALVNEGLLPAPMGVGVAAPIYAPSTVINSFFAFRTYTQAAASNTSPANTYSSYHTTYPWLTYSYAVI